MYNYKIEVVYPRGFYWMYPYYRIDVENLRFTTFLDAKNMLLANGLETSCNNCCEYTEEQYPQVEELKNELYVHNEYNGIIVRVVPVEDTIVWVSTELMQKENQ